MKKVLLCFIATFTLITWGVAQEKVNYIIVKTTQGEIASFNPAGISRLYIESGKWIFEMKNGGEKVSYPLENVLPFTTELRSPTGINLLPTANWSVYEDGSNLVISNPNGPVGHYQIYDIQGKVINSGYASENRVTVNVASGNIYIVKAGGKSIKTIKK